MDTTLTIEFTAVEACHNCGKLSQDGPICLVCRPPRAPRIGLEARYSTINVYLSLADMWTEIAATQEARGLPSEDSRNAALEWRKKAKALGWQ